MKTITKKINLYTFDELSDKAKEQVKKWYLEHCRDTVDFSEMLKDDIDIIFVHSNMDFYYSLNYCQGDGLCIFGTIDPQDIFAAYPYKFTDKEKRAIMYYNCNSYDFSGAFIIDRPMRGYFINYESQIDSAEDISSYMAIEGIRGARVDIIAKYRETVINMLNKFCAKWQEFGYEFFYEIEDDEMQEIADLNEWHFLENGELYND